MFRPYLHQYLENIAVNAFETEAFDKDASELIERTNGLATKDTIRARWEVAIRSELLSLTNQEIEQIKSNQSAFYGRMFNILDLSMVLAENECVDVNLPFGLVRELMESSSIHSRSQIFSWVERRGKRLILVLYAGKNVSSLLILRTLNELLRNLSKMTETEFCARILVFMNDIYPISERSGVNLKGEYGPAWEVPPAFREGKSQILQEMSKDEKQHKDDTGDITMTEAGPEPTVEQKKALFYNTFWFLQHPFSRPPSFTEIDTFKSFQYAVNNVLPVFSDATKKERTFAGSKTNAGNKRKREAIEEAPLPSRIAPEQHYIFAKYLTSPELLELQIADTNFRRQFLFQLLILLQHLRKFTEAEKSKWADSRNRSLQMDFTLSEQDENWVKEVNGKVILELRATTPDGRAFEEMIRVILERENNWVRWKNEQCKPFEKAPVSQEVEVELRTKRQKLADPPEPWKFSHGTRSLEEIWALGYKELYDLTFQREVPDPASILPSIQRVDKLMTARKAQLERIKFRQAPPPPKQEEVGGDAAKTPAPTPPGPTAEDKEKVFQRDETLRGLESQKHTHSWLALRSASRNYLHLFNKIGTGDVDKLVTEIAEEEEKKDGKKMEEEVPSWSEKAEPEQPEAITTEAGEIDPPKPDADAETVKQEVSSPKDVEMATAAVEENSQDVKSAELQAMAVDEVVITTDAGEEA